jgi:hypothetical protein
MDPFQIFAMGVTLAHLALLAGVFFGSSMRTHAYVSTEIHSMAAFRTFLSLLVLTEAVLCGTYIYVQGGSALRVASGLTFVGLSVLGWILVASFSTEKAEHFVGAVFFIASTSIYSFYFIDRARSLRPYLFFLWAVSTAVALAFCATYFSQLYYEAAALEWTAFMLDAATLFIFFYANPPSSLNPGGRQGDGDDHMALLLQPIVFGGP